MNLENRVFFDMYTVYVLYSESYNKIYIGFTSDLKARLLSHNELATKGWTIKYRPWKLIYSEEYQDKKDAMKREKELKSYEGRIFIRNKIF
jgi:putative endonuclease